MADCFWGSIEIGGSLPRSKVKDFLKAIKEDVVEEVDSDFIEENMDEETLSFEDDQARKGEFGDTESFCTDNGLSFVRQSDAYSEYSAEVSWLIEGKEGCSMVCKYSSHGNSSHSPQNSKPRSSMQQR